MRIAIVLAGASACAFDPPALAGIDAPATPGDVDGTGSDATNDATVTDGSSLICPTEYLAVTGAPNRYRVTNAGSFKSRSDDCKNDALGSTHLVVFETVAERNAVAAVFGDAWVGVVQAANQALPAVGWANITGGEVEVLLWGTNQPNDGGGAPGEDNSQNVALVRTSELDDDTASDSKPGICECDGQPVDPNVEAQIP